MLDSLAKNNINKAWNITQEQNEVETVWPIAVWPIAIWPIAICISPVDAATSGAASSGGGVNGLNNAALNTHGSNAAEKKNRCADSAIEKLDLAMLSFFEQFRKIYVGDQVQKTSKVYRKLSEVLGLQDEAMVMDGGGYFWVFLMDFE